jgi:hypothetical protein
MCWCSLEAEKILRSYLLCMPAALVSSSFVDLKLTSSVLGHSNT